MIRQDPTARPGSIREVKNELKLRGATFVTYQKLDQMRKIVVSSTTAEDTLAGADVTVIGQDWHQGNFRFRLYPSPPSLWMHAFDNSPLKMSATGYAGIKFDQGVAQIPVSSNLVGELADKVDRWVDWTNSEYRKNLREEAKALEQKEREVLRLQKEELEQKVHALRILSEREKR